MAFAHLHVHTQYSLLDGACHIDRLMERVKALGMDSVAITDHGVLYGAVDFYRAAKENGIHPVIGCEVYVAPGNMGDKTFAQREYAHLVLLCENEEGYKNLIKLVSLGFTEGYYYKPRIDMQALKGHSKGLIALSACLSGDIPKLLLDGDYQGAKNLANEFLQIMGEGNFFLEIQDHGLAEQKSVNPGLERLSAETGIPLVATNDAHYLAREDSKSHEVLLCIQTGKTLADPDRMSFGTDEFYIKSEGEMRELFPHLPEAFDITQEIAERCRYDFEFHNYKLPVFEPPQGLTAYGFLRKLCLDNLPDKYPDAGSEVYERLEYELDIINRMGYVSYFLIIWDVIAFARKSGIMVSMRGSGAASIVVYLLNITTVDPLRYVLLFERFLNPERISMPDVDLDFCYERRGEVFDYVINKYGADHVAQIITFGTMAARASVRDVGRALGMSYADCDQIAKLIPMQLGVTIKRAMEISNDLSRAYHERDDVKELLDTAMALEGAPRHASTHAAGVVISDKPVTDYIPIQKNGDVITTQFPMNTIEELGLLKMDFLGLRTLTVIRDSADLVKKRHGIDIDPDRLEFNDRETYEMMGKGDTDGCFQLESAGMRRVLEQLKPESLEDIMAIISLYRPGPMDSIPAYIAGKRNRDLVRYAHPLMKPVLEVTYGVIVYQEHVIQLVQALAGYTYGQADIIRRAMSKKKKAEMDRQREIFIHGLVENGEIKVPGAIRMGMPEKTAVEIFDKMESFAQYGFNKAHAACYAVVAYQTAYFKRHYLPEFMAATMNSMLERTEKIAEYILYCKKRGIAMLPPDVNESEATFTVDGNNIRFGLAAIKGVGRAAIEAIIKKRESGPYKGFYDFCDRMDSEHVNRKCVESLILSGAFDFSGAHRSQLIAVLERTLTSLAAERRRTVAGQISLFDIAGDAQPPAHPPLPDMPESPRDILLQWEKATTGVYISGHPLMDYSDALSEFQFTTADLSAMKDDEEAQAANDNAIISMGGLVGAIRQKATKSGQMMAYVTLEDMYGQVECLVFPRVFERSKGAFQAGTPVALSGRLSLREDEEPKIIVESARRMEIGGVPRGQKLCLLLPDAMKSGHIADILAKSPGGCPVLVKFADTGRSVRLAAKLSVMPSEELMAELERALGEGHVKLVGEG